MERIEPTEEVRGGEGGESTRKRGRNRGRKKGKNKFLNIMNINAQSLKGKMDEFRNLVKEQKPHIIGITETWGNEDTSDAMYQLMQCIN